MSKRSPSISFQDMELYYPILTKAEAIDQVASLIDFGLFDSELAKKKESTIEQ
jgi:hypothetical protein